METNELIEKVKEIQAVLPITTDEDDDNKRQLYFYKDGEYVESYDPVIKISTDGEVVKIENGRYTYEHKREEFDTMVIEQYED